MSSELARAIANIESGNSSSALSALKTALEATAALTNQPSMRRDDAVRDVELLRIQQRLSEGRLHEAALFCSIALLHFPDVPALKNLDTQIQEQILVTAHPVEPSVAECVSEKPAAQAKTEPSPPPAPSPPPKEKLHAMNSRTAEPPPEKPPLGPPKIQSGQPLHVRQVLAGRYEILAPLGTGGMSAVYKARDITRVRLSP